MNARPSTALTGDFTIRPARPGDAPAICGMATALGVEDDDPQSPFTAERYLEDGFGSVPAFRVLLAEQAGRAIGYVAFFPTYNIATAVRGLHVIDLYVLPERRRSGVGRALMGAVVDQCRSEGGKRIKWTARADNVGAISFYQHIGGRQARGLSFYLALDDPPE